MQSRRSCWSNIQNLANTLSYLRRHFTPESWQHFNKSNSTSPPSDLCLQTEEDVPVLETISTECAAYPKINLPTAAMGTVCLAKDQKGMCCKFSTDFSANQRKSCCSCLYPSRRNILTYNFVFLILSDPTLSSTLKTSYVLVRTWRISGWL